MNQLANCTYIWEKKIPYNIWNFVIKFPAYNLTVKEFGYLSKTVVYEYMDLAMDTIQHNHMPEL
jgi:hypothetical protein